MVELLAARAVDDAALVQMEDGLVGLDGDGDGLLLHRRLQLELVALGHVGVAGNCGDAVLGGRVARGHHRRRSCTGTRPRSLRRRSP